MSRTLPVPGLAEHAIGLKSLPDAIALRNHLLRLPRYRRVARGPGRAQRVPGFVFVGAGYAGLEGLAELQDFAAQAIELYPRCRAAGMRWVLVEARERIMPEVPPTLSDVRRRTSCAGAGHRDPHATRRSSEVREHSATLSDGETIPARMVVWTAGVKPTAVVARLGLPVGDDGRIAVDATMRVAGVPGGVWAIGDCAAVPDPARRGSPCPPTAQHAIRQGRLVARNIAAAIAGREPRAFRYKTKGVVAELGRNKGVAITLGVRWRGLPAWFIGRTYHLLLMPGVGRRLRLLADWNVALLFGREVSSPGRLGSPTPLGDDR